ncbi:uncharacterized protein LOC128735917 [Sabethes cyaneus]|uniref:uncharacterized protein LOC128735917 n=1 Tax=Sabethes cyaneus TaxID=53552 RepID=UPI00237DF40A|nr:uncharacterized protein LOC128735917 [Sabethes cyaneus]
MERKLMQEKYSLLEELEEERDRASNRSQVSRRSKQQRVNEWVEQQSSKDGAVGGIPQEPATERQAAPNPAKGPQRQQEETVAILPPHHGNQLQHTGAILKTVPNVLSNGRAPTSIGNTIPSLPPVLPLGKPPIKSIPKTKTSAQPSNHYQETLDKLGAISPVLKNTNPVEPTKTMPTSQNQHTSTCPTSTPIGRKESQSVHVNPCPNANDPSSNVNPTFMAARMPEAGPSPSQLAARQIMPRNLPPFAGNPADWPLFISAFVNTTAACGYSSVENLTRLQRCLKGAAYEAVRSCLLLAASVPQVINTLQLLYGRPELLINVLLDKVRSTPAPKVERLETLIEFGMAVQSLCDHLEAAGQQSHLTNPCLLMELVDKLPAHVKMEWANFMQQYPEVNLKTFGDFMNGVVISSSKVTQYTGGFGKEASKEQLKIKNKGLINAHINQPELPKDDYKQCGICNRRGHRVRGCDTFKSLSIDERWKAAQTNEVCRSCLNAHGRRSCRNSVQCGINGCTFRHHPLLHSNRNNQLSGGSGRPKVVTSIETAGNHAHRMPDQSLLFRIIPITLYGPKKTVRTFAFLDDGSSLTLVEEELARNIGASGISAPLCLTWTEDVSRIEAESKQLQLEVSSAYGGKHYPLKNIRTVKKLALPGQTLPINEFMNKFKFLRGLPLSDYDHSY